MIDKRIAFGAFCTWWGPIGEVARAADTGRGVPTCPHCSGILYEEPDEAAFLARLDAVPADAYPDYRKVMEWQRNGSRPCDKSYTALRAAYDAASTI